MNLGRISWGVVALAVSATACSSSAAPPDPSVATSACGGQLPFDIEVPLATGDPVDSGTNGQLVRTWRYAAGTFEVRWPPDPRELYGATDNITFGGMVHDASGITVDDYGDHPPSGVVTDRVVLRLTPTSPFATPLRCERLQFRKTLDDGTVETVGIPLTVGSTLYDLDPLIGPREDTTEAPAADHSIQCNDHATPDNAVQAAPTQPSPAEALRAFLDSADGTLLDIPTPPRPFHEYHVGPTYRYEHYTNWREHVSVIVTHRDDGWAVTAWSKAQC